MAPSPENVHEQLMRILASPNFSRADSLSRFLRYVVTTALEGKAEEIKETVLGMEVFGRGAGFDPRLDPIVRVTARKVRERLERYYGEEGRHDAIVIDLPKGTYVPIFRPAESIAATSGPHLATGARLRRPLAWLAIVILALAIGIGVWPSEQPMDPIQLTQIAGAPEAEVLPAFSPDGKSVAYFRGRTALDELVLQPEGVPTPRVLVRTAVPLDGRPFWTPDGTRVCYHLRSENYWCVGAAGGEPSRLLEGGGYTPQFTPDGKSFLVRRPVNGKLGVFHSTPPGAKPSLLEHDLGDQTSNFLLSPDGSKFAALKSTGSDVGVLVRPFRGGSSRQIAIEQGWRAAVQAWFPDNRHLLLLEFSEERLNYRLVIADSESSARHLVTIDGGVIVSAALSPDGRRIVYASTATQEGSKVIEYSMEGKRIRVLAPKGFVGSWSPRGDRFLYTTRNHGRTTALWTQAGDGTAAVQVSTSAPQAAHFSPDGQRIAYAVEGERPGIEMVMSMGGPPTKVLTAPATVPVPAAGRGPCWSADGKWLFYYSQQKVWRVASEGGGQPEAVGDSMGRLMCSLSGRWLSFVVEPRRPVAPGGFPGDIVVMSTASLTVRTFTLENDYFLAGGALANDGRTLYVPRLDRQTMDVVDTSTGAVVYKIRFDLEPTESIMNTSLNPDGTRLMLTTNRQPADLWSVEGFAGPEMSWLRWFRHWETPRAKRP